MSNKHIKQFFAFLALVFATIIVICNTAFTFEKRQTLSPQKAAYCDDFNYNGQGEHIDASYDVNYDSVNIYDKCIFSVPSYGNTEPTYTNFCAPLAGVNVVAYYDRWKENLIPNFAPGMNVAGGNYRYLPDLKQSATKALFNNMYTEMKTNVGQAGTTTSNFKNGLKSYVTKAGYNISTDSIYKNSVDVDLNKLTIAIDSNEVALILCTKYNFVGNIYNNEEGKVVRINKFTSNVGHIMMVYGYKKIDYYKNNSVFKTDHFLYVCSSFNNAEKGFMQLNDFSTIDEAYIFTIN